MENIPSVQTATLPDEKKILKEFPKEEKRHIPKGFNFKLVSSVFVVVLAGVITGWFLSGVDDKKTGKDGTQSTYTENSQGEVEEAGVDDSKKYPDTAEGVLEVGGIDGEGTHHLVRDGGASRYVYLISTVVDLDTFVGKKVEVKGETMSSGKKAGWFMDVGRIKVIK